MYTSTHTLWQDKGVVRPFVFCDLKKFLPAWVLTEGAADAESDDDGEPTSETAKQLAKELGMRTKRPKGTLPLTQWVMAFDAYALGAAVTGQWPLECSFTHKMLVLKLAAESKKENRQPQVAVIYDELVRRQMAEMSYVNAPGLISTYRLSVTPLL